jgi:hypothetical protein
MKKAAMLQGTTAIIECISILIASFQVAAPKATARLVRAQWSRDK